MDGIMSGRSWNWLGFMLAHGPPRILIETAGSREI